MSKTSLYIFLTITTVVLILLTHFTLNQSASEPMGLYRPTSEPLAHGALVLLRNPMKRLVGLPGDVIRTSPEGTYVNGKLIPNSAIPFRAPYRPYPFTTFTLAPDQYWTLGQHPLSYDARYYGPIPGSLIASTVKPVWTRR